MPIRNVALVGLGTMGHGIAARLVRGGLSVSVYDKAESAVERCRNLLPVASAALDALGIEPPDSGEGVIDYAASLAHCVENADLVIENVPEDEAIKAEVYKQIEACVADHILIVSDTSGIPITKLQAHLKKPGRFAGMHWSNPPHIIPMIEVIAGEGTISGTTDAIRNLIRELGLLPVTLKKDVPGFVENRVLYALLREVVDLVERDVIEPEDIDTCVSWGIGYKLAVIGPMALLDMAGLDIYKSVSSFLNQDLCDRDDVAPMINSKAQNEEFGIKSGKGIYQYSPERITALQGERAAKLIAIRRILEDRG